MPRGILAPAVVKLAALIAGPLMGLLGRHALDEVQVAVVGRAIEGVLQLGRSQFGAYRAHHYARDAQVPRKHPGVDALDRDRTILREILRRPIFDRQLLCSSQSSRTMNPST